MRPVAPSRFVQPRLFWCMRKGLIGRTIIPPWWNRLRIQAAVVSGRMRARLRRAGAWRMSSNVTSVALCAAADKDDAVFCRFVRARFNGSCGCELACLCQRQNAQRERDCQRHDQPMRHAAILSRNKSMRIHAVLLSCATHLSRSAASAQRAIVSIAVSRPEKSGRLYRNT